MNRKNNDSTVYRPVTLKVKVAAATNGSKVYTEEEFMARLHVIEELQRARKQVAVTKELVKGR